MAQLGEGKVGTGVDSYPTVIDTYQTFVNGASPAPDSASRIDSELVMDVLRTLVNIETILGAMPQGVFASLAARLNQALPGSGGVPGTVTFTNVDTVAIPGTQHNVGQAAFLFQLYDAASPAHAMEPGSFLLEVDSGTYDVFIDFSVVTSGLIALGITSPLYIVAFTNTTTVSVLGTTHQLGTADLFFQVYDAGAPRRRAMEPGSFTVHPTSFNVTMTFVTAQSGMLVLSAGGPMYGVNFTNASTLDIPGSVHLLGSRALLFQTYDAATPRAALGDPGVTVNPTTYDVHVSFATPTSGRFLLAPTTTLTGRDFDIRDSGVVDQSAVRLYSEQGNLHLQTGLGQKIFFEDKLGAAKMVLDAIGGFFGIGLTAPTHQLQLNANDAVKPVSSAWTVLSDAALKTDVEPFEDGLETVLQMAPVWYRPVETPEVAPPPVARHTGPPPTPVLAEKVVGLIAQELQAIAPYLVRSWPARTTPQEPAREELGVDRHAMDHLFINAFKALAARLDAQEAELARLREQVAREPADEEVPVEPAAEAPPPAAIPPEAFERRERTL